MYRQQIDNIPKDQKKSFKETILKREMRLNVYSGPEDKMIIEVTEPYIISEDWLKTKSEIKKNIGLAISDFRQWQFNQ